MDWKSSHKSYISFENRFLNGYLEKAFFIKSIMPNHFYCDQNKIPIFRSMCMQYQIVTQLKSKSQFIEAVLIESR